MSRPLGPTAVIALGGNALAPSGARSSITAQFQHTRESLAPVVDRARDGWKLGVVLGNGPQVGDELLRNAAARGAASPRPPDPRRGRAAGPRGRVRREEHGAQGARGGRPR